MSLAGTSCSLTVSASESNMVGGIPEIHGFTYQPSIAGLSDGPSGSLKAQKVSQQTLTLSTTPTDIDLTACAGGPANANINFTGVRIMYLENLDLVNSITIGGTAGSPANAFTNGLNGTFTLGPGEQAVFFWGPTGRTVAGANKLLRVVAAAGTPQLKIGLVGTGA